MSELVTNKEFVDALFAKHEDILKTKTNTKVVVDGLFATLLEFIAEGREVNTLMGRFILHKSPPRTCRNPKTGETVDVPLKTVLKFRPNKVVKTALNK